jgi:hypothetical protein
VTAIWLIGPAPPAPAIPLRARGGKSSTADRLREMLEMSVDEYEAAFERANILGAPPWETRRARFAGRRIRKTITEPAVVLGRDAWTAMGLPSSTRYFESVENFTLVPHPSGKNLAYNDPWMRKKLKNTIDDLLVMKDERK